MTHLRVALTGGIATGKSYCLSRFASLGVSVIDADAIARTVVEPETSGLAAIVKRFGSSILTPEGALDRAALARVVFAQPEARRDLDAIVHPLVYASIDAWFGARSSDELAIADVPLLFETGHERDFERVVVAACSSAQQLERLITLRGLSKDDAERRLAAQLPIDEKVPRADYVIDTSGSRPETNAQVIEVWERLRGEMMIR